jgi:phospholipid/cholesterol/gamma-HCH transport system substrate-binding protein
MKAIAAAVFTLALVIGSALYLLRARGYFEPKQHLVLVADNAEGVAAGMDLTFSGFPIGTVQQGGAGRAGQRAHQIDVREKDAKWLRTSSVFTLVQGHPGRAPAARLQRRADRPAAADGAERPVLRGDANEEIQRVIGAAKDVLDNLNQITAQNSELNQSMANLQAFTQKLQSRQGALHAIFGNEEDARKLVLADRARQRGAGASKPGGNADRWS